MKNEKKNNNNNNDNNNTGSKKYKYCVSLTQRRSEKISEFSLWYNSKKNIYVGKRENELFLKVS